MSYPDPALERARTYVISRGVPADGVGIVGDPAHGNEGYHVGWDRLRAGYGSQDYSYAESPRDRVKSNAAMGFDIGGMSEEWIESFNVWLVNECAKGAPDTLDIREVIYRTRDDKIVRWDRLGRRTTGDLSHLWHTHISYFRDSEGRDKTALFKRFFEGVEDLSIGTEKVIGNETLPEYLTRIERELWQKILTKLNSPAPVTVNVDAGQVASALLANPNFIPAIVKAVNDDAARRLAA